jgi:dTMP kinase
VSGIGPDATRGRFIVLEGIDGSGTTTQASRLVTELTRRGTRAVGTCEPTAGPIGRFIRSALKHELTAEGGAPHSVPWSSMALLFAADRLDHVESVVLPALREGVTVVCDRYVLSSLAYQSSTSPEGEASLPWIRSLNARSRPADLTIVLDVSEEVARGRRESRGGRPELFEVQELQKKLAQVYARAEELLPGEPVVHVNDAPMDDVAAAILAAVLK